ncbi:hypothetical protein ARTHRO8AJ_90038 [Arthrobacter sp. 8AJ]|nr:hypothetical protein ARTHRO8AJ_90038 [Arthrobacter sp. 8AJ]
MACLSLRTFSANGSAALVLSVSLGVRQDDLPANRWLAGNEGD